MEIERKYLVKELPENLSQYKFKTIKQAYLNTSPVIRIRQLDSDYFLTYKSKGLMTREEYELQLNKESFEHLLPKSDGNIIEKKRYLIPTDNKLTIELDIFEGIFQGLIIAEVEFPNEDMANSYIPPNWFYKDVTFESTFHNSNLSTLIDPKSILKLI